MFGALTEKLQSLFHSLSGKKVLTEDNIADAVREVRLALLDADVNYGVVSRFIKRVKDRSLGDDVVKSVSPGKYFTKIVHDELTALMGSEEKSLFLPGKPSAIMLCGLQGSGKTTQCAKLARYLLREGKERKILLVACDLQRPAAVDQLARLASQAGVSVFLPEGDCDPVSVARKAMDKARKEGFDVVIVDTAGRLHIDEELMAELVAMKKVIEPSEVLFVASCQIGQDAVKTAEAFEKTVGITGSILTMLDGSARAGAAISIREITGKPLKFEGIGEKIDDLRPFHPQSMADRILGMGDVINLVRKAEEHFDKEEEAEMEKKFLKASFTYGDYLKVLAKIRKMGSLKSLLHMIPGVASAGLPEIDEKELRVAEAIIFSMTLKEREEKTELTPSRRRRIARGSGVDVEEVNRLVKKFKKMKLFLKEMPGLQKQMQKKTGNKENFLWR